MQENQRVADMAAEVLARQAQTRAKQTGEAFEEALKAVLKTKSGRQLEELRDGHQGHERADELQHDLPRNRVKERRRAR